MFLPVLFVYIFDPFRHGMGAPLVVEGSVIQPGECCGVTVAQQAILVVVVGSKENTSLQN